MLAKLKKDNQVVFNETTEYPNISILMAAHNEEKVIKEKIDSVFKTNYPLEKIEFIIGSDNSTDNTNTIIKEFQKQYPQLKLFEYNDRSGKIGTLNNIFKESSHDILVLTDANVFFEMNTLTELVKNFGNVEINIVCANILNKGLKKEGISHQEKTYIQLENKLKYFEGKIWGTAMGAFGACFAIRKKDFAIIPQMQIVDDFFLTMKCLMNGGKAIVNTNAICYEDVSNDLKEEFRRKTRISSGNFQNLFLFWKVLFQFNGLSFSFLSHKVLRWLGPLFIIAFYYASLFLIPHGKLYYNCFLIANTIAIIPLIDYILKSIKINFPPFRYITHFLAMNLALFIGLLKFLRGTKTSVWEPTERNL